MKHISMAQAPKPYHFVLILSSSTSRPRDLTGNSMVCASLFTGLSDDLVT